MPERPVLALLDGHSLAYRAFFALPEELRTTTGQQTNAVYGFTSMLIKLLTEHRPDGIAVMFDKGRPVERLALMPDYKGTRRETPDAFRSQLPLISEVLDALAVPQVAMEGVEADDLIATYATLARNAGMDTLVVTGDRDVFQLVDAHTSVLYTRRGISDTVVMDAAAIEAKYGVGPDRYAHLAALRGDPSDNIPGVPGVGEKTAAKLLAEHGDLEGIFANLERVPGKKLPAMLAEHRQAVFDGYAVARLRRDIVVPLPVEALRRGDADPDAVRRLFATLEFRALWERLAEALDTGEQAAEAEAFTADPQQLGAGQLARWIDALPAGRPVAVLPFSQGRPPSVRLEGVALAAAGARPATATLAPLAREDLDALGGLLADPGRPLLVHDLKALCHAAGSRGWAVDGVRLDTELAAYLVQPQQRDYDLEALALQYLNKQLTVGASSEDGGGQLAMAVGEDWQERCLRAQALLDVAGALDDELAARDQADLLSGLELPLVPVLVAMERCGIAVDLEVLTEIGEALGDRMRHLREEIYGWADEEFNLDSPKQLQAILFDRLGLPKTKRIKTGYSTDAAALTAIVDTHPIVAPLLEYREVSKLKGTYVDALPPLVDPATGRIHAEFRQTVAVTGRLSSQHPNIQNIPIRSATGREIRRAFVPGEGHTALLVADYSQIELRVMAHLSGDEGLVAAFTSNEDIHATTAAMVWELPIDAVDNTLRSRIKGMTYGLAYGLSAYGLSQQLRIPPDEARELMEAYFARFPGVRDYLYGGVDQARKDGWTSTLFGRRRYLPDLMSDNRQRRDMAERMALNAPIQGTAADIIKKAMVVVHERMAARGMGSQLLLQVHDELVCETAPGEEEELRELLVDAMGGVADLAVPLEVDTALGPSWAEAEKH
ncbi:MAG TPA: DNA polymerase I [Egibacteraceae bacterium]|jgi:DNA polymerase I|nr:DNA polymerase I [Egibacteraceae bacterium]